MKKLWIWVCLAILAPVAQCADQSDMAFKVKGLVKEINQAMIQGKYDRMIALTHPKAVEQMGGAAKAMESIAKELYEAGRQGTLIKSVTVGDPLPMVAAGGKIYVATPFTLEVVNKDQDQIFSNNYVVGVSEDGENWVFVNGSTDIKKVKEILPDLPDNLQVPKTEAPAVRKASERVKAMVEELMKVEGEAWADSKPARELVGLGLASVENGLLEMLIDNDQKVRQHGEKVLAETLKEYFGYKPEVPATAERLKAFETAWKDNGNYRWDMTLEDRNKSHDKWKKWVADQKAPTKTTK